MKILAIDTASEYCSATVWLDGIALHRLVHAGQTHSQTLLPQCRELLQEAGVQLRELDGIAYGMGPGSFTGLRIACAVAQGLGFAAELPVIGINSLQALALASGQDRVIACIDARMGEVYHAVYQRQHANWIEINAPIVCKPAAAPLLNGVDWCGCGTGFGSYGEILTARYGLTMDDVQPDLLPSSRHIAELAVPQFAAGLAVAPEFAAPLYIRNHVALKISER